MKIKINQILKNFRDYVTTHDYQHTPMLTAYVDIDTTDPKNNRETPAWSIELKNQFKEIKARIDPEQLKRRSVQQRWEKAEERILEHLREQKLTGRSIAFFSDLDDYLAVDLQVKMPTRLYYGLPQVKHLLFALDQYKTYEVILFAEAEVRLVEVFLSRTSTDLTMNSEHGKTWKLGRKSMEAGVDRRSPEFERRFVNEIATEINSHYLGDLEFERLILGGNQKLAHAVKNALNPLTRKVVAAIQPMDYIIADRELANLVRGIADQFEEAYDLSVVETLYNTHGRGGPAVIMRQDVENGLAMGQVKELILPYPVKEEEFDALIVDVVLNGVDIEFVHGEAAEKLNQGSGIGAVLYY